MISKYFYNSPTEATDPIKMEIKAHTLSYNTMTEGELSLYLYKVDLSLPDIAGFYTRGDYPDEDDLVLGLLNADLKHWIVFYGLPEPFSVDWWRVVIHHRERSVKAICAAMYYRYMALFEDSFPLRGVV